jgi:D-glycero-D-manno-heptose 1,7-bisphosphate phosphatase
MWNDDGGAGGMKRAVFLDRDGVINQNMVRNGRPYAPMRVEDFVILPGVAEAVRRLRNAGYVVIVATNQPDVGAGRQSHKVVENMHERMRRHVPVDDVKVCYHLDEDRCACRKPKPGMLLNAADEHSIDLSQSWMIGDRWRDMAAGRFAGCRTVFVDYGYEEQQPESPDAVVGSLTEAMPFVLG